MMELFTHESRTLRALAQRGYKPAVIYDIGASNGVWSDSIALTLPDAEYYLFEPLAEAVPFYRRDLQERLARHANFRLNPIALSDYGGTAEMFVTHDGFGSSMLDRGDIPEVKQRVSVPVYTLDEFVERNALPTPSVIEARCAGRRAPDS